MRSGSCFLRPPLALRTGGSGSSCSPETTPWPTARAEESESAGNHPGATDSLTGATALWLTPHGMTGVDATGKAGAGGEFAASVEMWATPNVPSRGPESPESKATRNSGGVDLQTQVMLGSAWPTPASRDVKGTKDASHMDRSTGSMHLDQLPNFVAHVFTPTTAPSGPQDHTSGSDGPPSRPRLNPLFVAYLMGWPLPDANGCGFSATELSRFRRRWRSTFCDLVSRIEP